MMRPRRMSSFTSEVFGELHDLAGAQHVDAAVPDVRDEPAIARDQQRRVVVPMPRFSARFTPSGRWPARRLTAARASPALLRAHARRLSRGARRIVARVHRVRNSCTATCDATSPDAWPPMPSATTNSDNFLSTRKLSSLISRFLPTSVAAQKDSSMAGPRPIIGITKADPAVRESRKDYASLTGRAPLFRSVRPPSGGCARGSSNGRTPDSGSGYQGSNPCPRTSQAEN